MMFIMMPILGIILDVLSNSIQFVMSDDMFVIIALPDAFTRGVTENICMAGDSRFEGPDNRT